MWNFTMTFPSRESSPPPAYTRREAPTSLCRQPDSASKLALEGVRHSAARRPRRRVPRAVPGEAHHLVVAAPAMAGSRSGP